MTKFKEIFEAKSKFKAGDKISDGGDVYTISKVYNDEMSGLLVYQAKDKDGNEEILNVKVIDKSAKKA